jgi:hypothetical protein
VLLNLGDLLNVRHHRDRWRLGGCCGSDGLSGSNRVCNRGHEIGTAFCDCWMPHYLRLDPNAVQGIPADRLPPQLPRRGIGRLARRRRSS